MGIRKTPSRHNFPAEGDLSFMKSDRCGLSAAVKVFSEIIIVPPFVGFQVIVEDNHFDISTVRLEWLYNEGRAERSSDHLIVYVFNIRKEMNSQTAIFTFPFENDPGDFLFLIKGDGFKEGLSIIYCAGTGQHIVAEQPCLEDFRAARQLCRCRRDKCYPSFSKISQQMFLSNFQTYSSADNCGGRQLVIVSKKGVIISYRFRRVLQKIIFGERW